MSGPEITQNLIVDLERIEIEAWEDLCSAASGEVINQCGVNFLRAGGACAGVASEIDTLVFNRIIGAGLSEKFTEDTLDKLTAPFDEAAVGRLFCQLAPGAEPAEISNWLKSRGFIHHNNWIKLYRDTSPIQPVKTDLRIEEVGSEYGATFGEILVKCFGWSDKLAPWIGATVGRPHWRHYLAFDGDKPVATAGMYVSGDYSWIDLASTLPEYRGRGAQGALVERRFRDCAEAGVQTIVVETAEQTEQKEAPSFRNMIRYGFRIAYARPNYLLDRKRNSETAGE